MRVRGLDSSGSRRNYWWRMAIVAAVVSLGVGCSGGSAGDGPAAVGGDTGMVDGEGDDVGTDANPVDEPDGGEWGLRLETPPPGEVAAGEAFDVELGVSSPAERRGVEVTVGLRDGAFAGGESEVTTTTDADGVAAVEVAIEEAGSGYVLEGRIGAASGEEARVASEPFEVLAAEASSETSSITGEGGAAADGQEEATVTVELHDAYGNPVVGEVPEFEATGEGNSYEACSATDQNGVSECAMTSTTPGEKRLRLTAPVELEGGRVEFVPHCNPDLTPFGGGDGSSENPHLICTPEHLESVGKTDTYLDDAFRVVDDIDMSQVGDFNIIAGNYDTSYDGPAFTGTFDGGGYAIRNLTVEVTDTEADGMGLFGTVGEQARLEEIVLEGVTVRGRRQIGGLAGTNRGEIVGVEVTGEAEGEYAVGGAVGVNAEGGVVRKSHAEAKITGWNTTKAGGLVGNARPQTKVVDSSANVEMPEELDSSVGGLVGRAEGEIVRSYATGQVSGHKWVGGLVGNASGENTSGQQSIRKSFAAVTVDADQLVGGLVGLSQAQARIEESFATGSVTARYSSVGGLIGEVRETTLVDVYAAGAVDGPGDSTKGGLIGTHEVTADAVERAYWDVQTSGISTSSGLATDDHGTGLNTGEFADPANFEGWDFQDTWTIQTAPDGEQRPVLQWRQE